MYVLLSGLIAGLAFVAATIFLRNYTARRDRLFAYFASAFFILGATQLFLGITNTPELNRPLAYIPRLVAFVLILVAIAEKNRARERMRRPQDPPNNVVTPIKRRATGP